MTATTLTDAWSAALAAEQQAAFGYPLLGPKLHGADQTAARADQAGHEQVRDRTAEQLAAAGITPVAPLGDYPALYPLASSPRTLAAHLEDACASAWRYLYAEAASTAPTAAWPAARLAALRKQAQQALTASAVRATRWRMRARSPHPVVPFPGS